MSFLDLYLSRNPLLTSSNNQGEVSSIVFGVPFDSTHSYRPGARFGPDAIREAFNNIEIFFPDFGIDLESINIEDLGNLHQTVVATEMLDMTGKVTAELIKRQKPLVILGGEHLITLGTYLSFPKDTGYIVFDAHYDLRDEYADQRLSHAACLRRIIEKRGAENIIHVGARAFVKEELVFKEEHKVKTVSDKDIRAGNGAKLIKDAISTFDKIYLSVDLDVLDPAFAPGVGNPEAVGISSRELFDMLYSLQEKKIPGADIVELCPQYDNGATTSIAAKVMALVIAINQKK